MHLLATGAGLLSKGQVDEAVLHLRDTDDQRPVDLARGAAGEGFREIGGGARRTRQEEDARRVLVATVDELGAHGTLAGQYFTGAVEVRVQPVAALHCHTRLVLDG